jgi:uncharacterized membrane protein YkvA (DUF1232 family)
MIAGLKEWARAIKRDIVALYIAGRDPRVPWHVKLAAAAVAAYALSPIDLIPATSSRCSAISTRVSSCPSRCSS